MAARSVVACSEANRWWSVGVVAVDEVRPGEVDQLGRLMVRWFNLDDCTVGWIFFFSFV